MIAGIISLLTLILTIAWGVVRYYHSRGYKKDSLKKQIKRWEDKLGKALYENDATGITLANAELKRLRQDYALLPDK